MSDDNEGYALPRTCDSCAQFAPCRMDAESEVYVCEQCDREHEVAVQAAADAVAERIYPRQRIYGSQAEFCELVARSAVHAYLKATYGQEAIR